VTDKLLTSSQVRQLCGDVSDMTLWRWQQDAGVNFPKPSLVINRRRYWDESAIIDWRNAGNKQNLVKAAPPKIKARAAAANYATA
jgi:predicted DNA-binding transcriptional regulator AlpA